MTRPVVLSSRAIKEYSQLSKQMQKRVKIALEELGVGSKQLDIKKLKGTGDREDLYRLRVGDHRITYYPEPDIIKVIRIDHRGKGYGWLD